MIALLGTLLAAAGRAADEGSIGLRPVVDSKVVSVVDNARPILRYRYGDVRKKPYLDQLFSPSGVQILRDGAPDHVHHHGLMFAIRIDGVNFWEETTPDVGTEKHRSLGKLKSAVSGIERAGLTEELDWLAPNANKPLLVERREIVACEGPRLGATLLTWRTRLEVPPGKKSALLTGTHYNGLGMRFVPSMDHSGHYFAADDNAGEAGPNNCRLTAARWVAYTAKADGKPVTVALFDHPTSYRHPAVVFTKNVSPNWYSYLAATMNEWKKPITMASGQPLSVCYGIALWDGQVDAATVEKLYQQWVKLSDHNDGR
ncbi:MAG: DUF6807 family protein [Thermoguttaceae bacterium]